MKIKEDMEEIDWKIIREIKKKGRIKNVEIEERVGI